MGSFTLEYTCRVCKNVFYRRHHSGGGMMIVRPSLCEECEKKDNPWRAVLTDDAKINPKVKLEE